VPEKPNTTVAEGDDAVDADFEVVDEDDDDKKK
jgi:hypothetical protein